MRSTARRTAYSVVAGFLALPLSVGAGWAQNVYEGELVAKQWCSGCHQVSAEAPAHAEAGPSFLSVAGMNSTTQASLNAWLSSSHRNMPDFTLTRQEIRDVTAYIISLRKTP